MLNPIISSVQLTGTVPFAQPQVRYPEKVAFATVLRNQLMRLAFMRHKSCTFETLETP